MIIHHWKALDLEIADFNCHHGPIPSGEIISSQTSRYVLRGCCLIMRALRVKKAKLEELSNNKSEKRFELEANEPVSERSQ